MICFHHSDDDGLCAGAIVNHYGIRDDYEDQFIEMNYGFEVPFGRINPQETVYIVDFSLEPDDMRKLLEITEDVIWIDHHITAIEKYNEFEKVIAGVRSVEESGCMLTYKYFNPNTTSIPLVVQLCDDYDMWKFEFVETRDFHNGFSIVNHTPLSDIWAQLFFDTNAEDKLKSIIHDGVIISKYREKLMNDIITAYGFECILDGHTGFAINQALISSDDFKTIDASKYEFLAGFVYTGSRYSYSFRSTDLDVRQLCEKYGGGGHIHAAGCSSEELILQHV